MKIRLLLSIVSALLLLGTTAYAQDSRFSDAVVFSRQKLTINAVRVIEIVSEERAAVSENEDDAAENQADNAADEEKATAEPEVEPKVTYEEQDVAYAFDVMVRPLELIQAGSLQQLGWMKHDEGMMLTLEESDVISLADLGITASVDVLFIRPNGLIDAIAPAISPEQLAGAIETRKPVIAALLLKEGMAEHLKLEPGNQVNHKHFQPDTRVIR